MDGGFLVWIALCKQRFLPSRPIATPHLLTISETRIACRLWARVCRSVSVYPSVFALTRSSGHQPANHPFTQSLRGPAWSEITNAAHGLDPLRFYMTQCTCAAGTCNDEVEMCESLASREWRSTCSVIRMHNATYIWTNSLIRFISSRTSTEQPSLHLPSLSVLLTVMAVAVVTPVLEMAVTTRLLRFGSGGCFELNPLLISLRQRAYVHASQNAKHSCFMLVVHVVWPITASHIDLHGFPAT